MTDVIDDSLLNPCASADDEVRLVASAPGRKHGGLAKHASFVVFLSSFVLYVVWSVWWFQQVQQTKQHSCHLLCRARLDHGTIGCDVCFFVQNVGLFVSGFQWH